MLTLFEIIRDIGINVAIEKVKGHSGNTFNEDADNNARLMSVYAMKEGIADEGQG